MYYSPSTDPSGRPWTASSVSQEINRLAYELFRVGNIPNEAAVCGNIVTARGIETGPVDEDACDALFAGVREQLVEIEAAQRELQAIAAHIAQPGTPSVIGPGAVNVVVDDETGAVSFVTSPTLPADVTPSGAVLPNGEPPPVNGVVPSDGYLPEDDGEGAGVTAGAGESRGIGPLALAGIGLGLAFVLGVFGGRKRSSAS